VVSRYGLKMSDKIGSLKAEMEAINLWDHLFANSPNPSDMEKDACVARLFRRVQVAVELQQIGFEKLASVRVLSVFRANCAF
jgi:hypothetical protein